MSDKISINVSALLGIAPYYVHDKTLYKAKIVVEDGIITDWNGFTSEEEAETKVKEAIYNTRARLMRERIKEINETIGVSLSDSAIDEIIKESIAEDIDSLVETITRYNKVKIDRYRNKDGVEMFGYRFELPSSNGERRFKTAKGFDSEEEARAAGMKELSKVICK